MNWRIRQRHMRWLFLTAFAITLYLWNDNPLTQLVALVAIAVTTVSFAWTAAARPQAVAFTIGTDAIVAGQPMNVQMHLSAGLLPLPWVQVTDESPIWPRPPRHLLGIGGRRAVTVEQRLVPGRRGIYTFGPVDAKWGDPFGFFENRRQLDADDVRLTVYPRVVPLVSLPVPVRQPFGVRRPRPQAFEDVTMPADQRPYRPGDGMRRVNWKTSARLGELYTREYDYTATTDLHIVLDLAAASFNRAVTGLGDDEPAAELAAAVAEFGLRNGFGVSLTTYAAERLHAPLRRGRHQLQPFLQLLAVAAATGEVPMADLLRREMPSFGPLTTVVVITPDVSRELAAALADLRQRQARVLVLAVCPPGSRVSPQWEQQLLAIGVACRSVSGPDDLNEGGGDAWISSAPF